MMKLTRLIDKVTGYVFMPHDGADGSEGGTTGDNLAALFSSASGLIPGGYQDVSDVQERWGDRREEFDEAQMDQWEKEWAARHQAQAVAKAAQSGGVGASDGVPAGAAGGSDLS